MIGVCTIFTTSVPGKVRDGGNADDEVKDGPTNDDAIVDIEKADQHHCSRPSSS